MSKYDRDGNLLWTDLFGTDDFDTSQGIAVDSSGKIYVSGFTHGNFDGTYESSINQRGDVFVAKFSQPVPEPGCWSLCLMACFCAICFSGRVRGY